MAVKTVRLTVAQALVKFLCNQMTNVDGEKLPIVSGCWAIFGHGNVAGIGEALYQYLDRLPTYRAHNEQAMALAACAFAKATFRRRFMACTSSIGPGALNMVTAAAVAHVDRLPLLLLPGDVFANRMPDPVLQQIEDFTDGVVTANDCFRPVSRYFDRIDRPEQLISALQRAMRVLTHPADCGPGRWRCARTCRPKPSIGRKTCSTRRRGRRAGNSPTTMSLPMRSQRSARPNGRSSSPAAARSIPARARS